MNLGSDGAAGQAGDLANRCGVEVFEVEEYDLAVWRMQQKGLVKR